MYIYIRLNFNTTKKHVIIYKLTSPSLKSYIGLTTKTAAERFTEHKQAWRRAKGTRLEHTRPLFAAFSKYGPENFTVETIATAQSLEDLQEQEVFYINKFQTTSGNGYNVLMGGEIGTVIHSKERNKNVSHGLKLFYASEAGIKLRAEIAERRKASKASKETLAKMSEAAKASHKARKSISVG